MANALLANPNLIVIKRKLQLILFIRIFNYLHVCMTVQRTICHMRAVSAESRKRWSDPPAAGVVVSCELTTVGAGS